MKRWVLTGGQREKKRAGRGGGLVTGRRGWRNEIKVEEKRGTKDQKGWANLSPPIFYPSITPSRHTQGTFEAHGCGDGTRMFAPAYTS